MRCTDCESPITRPEAGGEHCPACQESRLRRGPGPDPWAQWDRERVWPSGYQIEEDDGSPD